MIKRLLPAMAALLSMGAAANLLQPVLPINEDTPVRVIVGTTGGLNNVKVGAENKFGLTTLNVGVGVTHDIDNDFTYGASASVGLGTTPSYKGRIFTDAAKNVQGLRVDADLMARYMPQMAEHLRAGLVLGLNWNDQWKNNDAVRLNRSFGDLGVKAGLAMSYGFSDSVSAYVSARYNLNNIRFGVKESLKASTNVGGVEFPVGVWFGDANKTGLFVEANTRFLDLKNFGRSFREEVTIGVSYAI